MKLTREEAAFWKQCVVSYLSNRPSREAIEKADHCVEELRKRLPVAETYGGPYR